MPPEAADPVLRPATRGDLGALVRLLADDVLGVTREDPGEPLAQAYRDAFEAIDRDTNHVLAVAERDGAVVGVLQLSFLPGLTHRGAWRAQLEGVRVASSARSTGVGRRLVAWAVDRARERGCRLVQLTTDRRRPDALRFYEALGFEATHDGLKLRLEEPS